MTKKASQKDRRKALINARKDGKISGKEAQLLRSLGIPQKQIEKTNVRGNTVKIGKNAKASPAASSNSNVYKDVANTATEAINTINTPPKAPKPPKPPTTDPQQALANAKKDGVIKANEAENLLGLGLSLKDVRQSAIPDGVRVNKGAQSYYEQNQKYGQFEQKPLFDKKELRALQGQAAMGIPIYNGDPNDPETTDPNAGQPNYYNFGGDPYQNQNQAYFDRGGVERNLRNNGNNLSNLEGWAKVAKELNIKSVDRPEDLGRMFAYVMNYDSNNNSNNSNNNSNNNPTNADRDSGKFEDIKDALGEDADASFERADELDNKEVDTTNPYQGLIDDLLADLESNGLGDDDRITGPVGTTPGNGGDGGGTTPGGGGDGGGAAPGDGAPGVPPANPYQDIIDALTASNSQLTDQTQQLIDDNAVAQSGFEDALAAQAQESTDALSGLNDLFTTSFTGITDQMAQQQTDFNTAQAFTQQQLSAANAAFLAEQQRSANLQNAYVPGANPNALSIGYGDNRDNKKRQPTDNSLSDLTILSGLGTQGNPLAGLQLA